MPVEVPSLDPCCSYNQARSYISKGEKASSIQWSRNYSDTVFAVFIKSMNNPTLHVKKNKQFIFCDTYVTGNKWFLNHYAHLSGYFYCYINTDYGVVSILIWRALQTTLCQKETTDGLQETIKAEVHKVLKLYPRRGAYVRAGKWYWHAKERKDGNYVFSRWRRQFFTSLHPRKSYTNDYRKQKSILRSTEIIW